VGVESSEVIEYGGCVGYEDVGLGEKNGDSDHMNMIA
jgi:hypothetical protein